MIVLDTDHISLLQHPESPEAQRVIQRLAGARDDEVFTTIVSVEEQMRSWLAIIARYRDAARQTTYYARLLNFIRFFQDWEIVVFDAPAAEKFNELRAGGVRIGSSDLKIASIVLVHGATLISRNQIDFSKVPGLVLEDWSN